MKSNRFMLMLAALLGVVLATTLHAQSSAFSHQGCLTENDAPANGTYDFLLKDDLTQLDAILGQFPDERF